VNRQKKISEVEKKTLFTLFGIKLEEGNELWSPYTQFVAHVLTLWLSELKERTDVLVTDVLLYERTGL